ncbi:MAG TPA: hypothetical protein ENN60_03425 [archaeon]|nr:hypothetical protein [archaeon]
MIPVEQVRELIRSQGYKRVLFHLPAGLMPHWGILSELVPEPLFSADPCFGACDVPLHLMADLKADAILSFGHSKPPGFSYPDNIHFVEIQLPYTSTFIPPFRKVGLVYAIQYREASRAYARTLEKAGKTVVWGGKPGFMATHLGQVTGCDTAAASAILSRVDGFVVCADGVFHIQAVATLGKPTFNWLGETAKPPRYPVALLSTARTVGILVSTKTGQFHLNEAENLLRDLKKLGKQAFIVAGDTLTLETGNFQADCWVITACPRMAQDLRSSIPYDAAKLYIKGIYKEPYGRSSRTAKSAGRQSSGKG